MPGPEPVSAVETAVYAGRLRLLRARSSATRGAAAAAADLTVEAYIGLETGRVGWGGVTVETAQALLDALGVADERDLLARVPTPPPAVPLPRRAPDDQHPLTRLTPVP